MDEEWVGERVGESERGKEGGEGEVRKQKQKLWSRRGNSKMGGTQKNGELKFEVSFFPLPTRGFIFRRRQGGVWKRLWVRRQ